LHDSNVLTLILSVSFFLPIIMGAFEHFTQNKVKYLLYACFDNVEFLLGLLFSVYLCKKIFFENSSGLYKEIYERIPDSIRLILYGQDVLIYLFAVPALLILVLNVFSLLSGRLVAALINSLTKVLYRISASGAGTIRAVLGALSQVPRAAFVILLLGMALNFFAYYFPSPLLSRTMNESIAYQFVYKYALYPVLNSNMAKKIPVLVNDSFGRNQQNAALEERRIDKSSVEPEQCIPERGSDSQIIKYFNGVTLDEAIESDFQIDETARSLISGEEDSRLKAYLIYNWLSQNVSYDYYKAARVTGQPNGIASGSTIAFYTRKGICFDYACLYISMCRAVGLKVRLLTGLGYSGITWGDHAWNQVYSPEEDRWINVDATFAGNGNYFDKADFNADHRNPEIQGEW